MPSSTVISRAYVIGGGLSGLAAALSLADAGIAVTVLEASRHLGGRCRSYVDPELGLIDNGNHALTIANPVALGLVRRFGLADRWRADGALPMADVERRSLALIRPRFGDFWALGLRPRHALALLGPDRPVTAIFPEGEPVYRNLIDPLTVAALNTVPREASSRLLGRIFLEGWRGPLALLPLVAANGLGPDLVDPLAAEVAARGGEIRTLARVRALARKNGRIAAIDLGAEQIALSAGDRFVLAPTPAEAERLLETSFGFTYSPIVNAHFAVEGKPWPEPAMIGVLGAAAQWVLLRGDIASVTVSAADDLVDQPADELGRRLWGDVAAVLALTGRDVPVRPRAERIVKEKRATIRQPPGLVRPGAATPFSNLVLAGDYTQTGLPATIEGALRSGITAAKAARHGSGV